MKQFILFLSFAIIFFNDLQCQEIKMCAYRDYMSEIDLNKSCGQNSYLSNREAEGVVDDILNNVGLFRNFIIKECPNISNAVAATIESPFGNLERYIIYDPKFLESVKNRTNTNWGSTSILAHEIGHHLNGHTLFANVDNLEAELQADQFSGFVLARMGATLDQSLRAITEFGSDIASDSHPKKSDRIEAIVKGWNSALGKSEKGNTLYDKNSIILYNYDEFQMNFYVKKAIEYQNINKNQKAGEALIKAFQYSAGLEKKYLYYAASNFITALNYSEGLKYYLFLLKNGIYSLEKKEQKEVYKNIALIYMSQGDNDKAINAMDEAKRMNPEDLGLVQSEADMYYKMGNKKEYQRLMTIISSKSPKNATVLYNLGVTAFETGKIDEAVSYYEQALALQPQMDEARLNLAAAILSKESEIVNKMNSLGMSQEDTKKYNILAKQRLDIYRKAIPYLESVIKNNPRNKEAIRTTMNVYKALGEDNKAKNLEKQLNGY